MERASEELRHEHESIKIALSVLDDIATKIQQSENVDVQDLKELVEFVVLFADKNHHGKEEDLYFPSLEEAGIPKDGGPIGVMLAEHEQGRSNIRAMRESVSEQNADLQTFANAAFSYVALMRNHIEKENNILFMMGDRMIPGGIQTELLTKFREHEEKVLDEEKYNELQALLVKLEKKYLG